MTIHEAIEHSLDVAGKLDKATPGRHCRCSQDHRQLAAWLYELTQWREHPFKMLLVWLALPRKYRHPQETPTSHETQVD